MGSTFYAMLGFSFISLLLGFIALLTQKIYIDSNSNQPVDIEIPLLGKIKTNYPALVFVVGGLLLAWYSYDKSTSYDMATDKAAIKKKIESTLEKNRWIVTGMLQIDPKMINEEAKNTLIQHGWKNGNITSFPHLMNISEIEENGRFKFEVEIPKGKNFEEIIEILQFDNHPFFFGQVNIENTIVVDKNKRTRIYDFSVTPFLTAN